MREKLCRTLRYISQKVWDWMGDSQYFGFYQTSQQNIIRGLGFGEETITDLVLLEITKRQPYDVITVKYGRTYEAHEGADWEWWILSTSGIIGLRFQAKRVHFSTSGYEYTHLDYKQKNNQYQVDILIQRAQRLRLVPLYIFYNFWDLDYPFYKYISHLNNFKCCRVYSRRNLGITIASAVRIKNLIDKGKKRLSDVLSISYPIYALGCCNFSDLSESIFKFIDKLF